MARSAQTNGALIYGTVVVYDTTDTPVTGLLDGAFTKYVSQNGVSKSNTVTVTEIANGRYSYTFTPTSIGYWHVLIIHATYNVRGWQDEFDVS